MALLDGGGKLFCGSASAIKAEAASRQINDATGVDASLLFQSSAASLEAPIITEDQLAEILRRINLAKPEHIRGAFTAILRQTVGREHETAQEDLGVWFLTLAGLLGLMESETPVLLDGQMQEIASRIERAQPDQIRSAFAVILRHTVKRELSTAQEELAMWFFALSGLLGLLRLEEKK